MMFQKKTKTRLCSSSSREHAQFMCVLKRPKLNLSLDNSKKATISAKFTWSTTSVQGAQQSLQKTTTLWLDWSWTISKNLSLISLSTKPVWEGMWSTPMVTRWNKKESLKLRVFKSTQKSNSLDQWSRELTIWRTLRMTFSSTSCLHWSQSSMRWEKMC